MPIGIFRCTSLLAVGQLLDGAVQILGGDAGVEAIKGVGKFLNGHFADHSQRLTEALATSNERAWKALEIALAGKSFWNWLGRREDKELRRQIREFLDAVPAEVLPADRDDYRRQCLDELRDARAAGLLEGKQVDTDALAQQAAEFARFGDLASLVDAEWKLVREVANELANRGYKSLPKLLATRPAQDTPLLVLAVRYFFRRAVEEDEALFRGLAWASWQRLGEAQEQGFDRLGEALAENHQRLDRRLSELAVHLVQIHGDVLDIREEQKRHGEQHQDIYQAVIDLHCRFDVLARDIQPNEPALAKSEGERQLIQQVVQQYRALPAEHRSQLPALLKGIAKLQLAAGQVEDAEESYRGVTVTLADPAVRAESHYYAYQAALQRRDWVKAVASYRQAARLDRQRWTRAQLVADFSTAMQVDTKEARDYIKGVLTKLKDKAQ